MVVLQGLAGCAEASPGLDEFKRIRTARANRANRSNRSNLLQEVHSGDITTGKVVEAAREVIARLDVDLDPEKVTARREKMALHQLRLSHNPGGHGKPHA